MTNHIPPRGEVYRRLVGQIDPETLDQFDNYLALLARNIDRGRLDAARANVEELRSLIRERWEAAPCPSP